VPSTVRHQRELNHQVAGLVRVFLRAEDMASRMRMRCSNVMFDTVRGRATPDADR
jgi:hypothetical protein